MSKNPNTESSTSSPISALGAGSVPLRPMSLDDPMDRLPDGLAESEAEQIWQKYKGVIISLLLLVIIGSLGYFFWQAQAQGKHRAATQALAAAKGQDALRQVATDFSGEPAGGNALLMLAAEQMEAKDFPAARATYEEFTQQYPSHQMAPMANYAIAGLLENEGKPDEALARYDKVLTEFPGSFVETAALHGKGRLLTAKGDVDAARAVYQKMVGEAGPADPAGQLAERELKMLNRHGETFSTIDWKEPEMPQAPNPTPGIPGMPGMNLESTIQNAINNAEQSGEPQVLDLGTPTLPEVPSAPDTSAVPEIQTGNQPKLTRDDMEVSNWPTPVDSSVSGDIPAAADSTAPEVQAPATPQEAQSTDTPGTTLPAAETPEQTPGAPQP